MYIRKYFHLNYIKDKTPKAADFYTLSAYIRKEERLLENNKYDQCGGTDNITKKE